MSIQNELREWAEETVNVYNSITETLNKKDLDKKWGYYTQTPLSLVSQSPDLLILGINPGAEGGKDYMTGEELLKGNPCFENKDKKNVLSDKEYVIYVMKEKKDNDKNINGWALWHRLNNMLEKSINHKKLLQDFNRFVLSNMIFFGTAKENQIPKIDKDKCAERTLKLIDILEPKVVLLLGNQCRDLFNKMSDTPKLEEIVPQSISYCYYKEKYHILSIKHTAYRYSSYEMKIIGNTICYAIDNSSTRIDKNKLYQFICKEANGRAWYLKAMIGNNGSIQNIYNEKTVYHEFYTKQKEGKRISSNDRIVIDLTPEEDKSQYAVLVFTRQNNEEKTKELIKGIWPNEEFNPWECNKSRHVHEMISFEESNEDIKNKMEKVIQEVRAYRDKEYPLKK